jgi:hypothetical protein
MFDIQVLHSVEDTDPYTWDVLGNGLPFTSHNWYRFGEKVMGNCQPAYIILSQNNRPLARATFWKIANEPLPLPPLLFKPISALLRHWPLLICRAPLVYASGLVLPDSDLRVPAQQQIAQTALELLQKQADSFAILDFLAAPEAMGWPQPFTAATLSDPGTVMPLNWPTFAAWLDSGNKKDRQHYKRTQREAEKLGLSLTRHSSAGRLDEAMPLIRGVEQRHASPPNPWVRGMLENMELVNGTYITAAIGERLVGCGLLLEDNGAQMTTALGLAADVPYVYFMLIYESLKIAFERHIRRLHWGSGAYDVKQRLGFQLEDNNTILYATAHPILSRIGQWLGKYA